MRYMFLAYHCRMSTDHRSFGDLFHVCCEEIRDITFIESLMRILKLTADRMRSVGAYCQKTFDAFFYVAMDVALNTLSIVKNSRVKNFTFLSLYFSRLSGVTKAESATYTKGSGLSPCRAMCRETPTKSSLFNVLSDALPSSVVPKMGMLRSTHSIERRNCFRSGRLSLLCPKFVQKKLAMKNNKCYKTGVVEFNSKTMKDSIPCLPSNDSPLKTLLKPHFRSFANKGGKAFRHARLPTN